MGAARGAHLPPVQGALAACERQLPAHVEEHVVLARGPLLHKVGGEHPRPEDDAVVLEAPCARRPEGKGGEGTVSGLGRAPAPRPAPRRPPRCAEPQPHGAPAEAPGHLPGRPRAPQHRGLQPQDESAASHGEGKPGSERRLGRLSGREPQGLRRGDPSISGGAPPSPSPPPPRESDLKGQLPLCLPGSAAGRREAGFQHAGLTLLLITDSISS